MRRPTARPPRTSERRSKTLRVVDVATGSVELVKLPCFGIFGSERRIDVGHHHSYFVDSEDLHTATAFARLARDVARGEQVPQPKAPKPASSLTSGPSPSEKIVRLWCLACLLVISGGAGLLTAFDGPPIAAAAAVVLGLTFLAGVLGGSDGLAFAWKAIGAVLLVSAGAYVVTVMTEDDGEVCEGPAYDSTAFCYDETP